VLDCMRQVVMNTLFSRFASICSELIPIALLLPACVLGSTAKNVPPESPIVIDATAAPAPPKALPFPVGGRSPRGHVLGANDRYLTFDGNPWFPLMGEFHYARYPESAWEKELLKIKAAGITVVSTYVFWIHHEEVESTFDWSGQRDLRRFVQLCAKHGLYVWIRIGPWGHGEVRNGGLPDWLLAKTAARENNPVYLDDVRRFDSEIAKQVSGMFWKDGGPIIGIQLENEYSARGPGKGEEHILRLREIARETGLDAPFFTVTGWDNAVVPSRDILPTFGGYADGFWWRSLTELPPTPNYFFTNIRCEENVDFNLQSKHPEIDSLDTHYPFLTAEMGGGMANSYHRRPVLAADDTAAMEIVKLGSGVVGYGYYMFHGGTNPDGVRTTLQESQATGYPNDLPVKSYDFQAPLGEFGQVHDAYRVLKTLHLFLNDFGASLVPMTSYFPERQPKDKEDVVTPRVAARMRQDQGFLFINNHERAQQMPEKKKFQVQIKLASGTLQVPRNPTNIPSDAYTIWPLNLDLGSVTLHYATAQLLCKLDEPRTYVFFAWPGITPEFAFDNKKGISIESSHASVVRVKNVAYVNGIAPGTQSSIYVRSDDGTNIRIMVLSREQALNLWKLKVAGKDRLVLSPANLYFADDGLHLTAEQTSSLKVGLLPALAYVPAGFKQEQTDGVFETYGTHVDPIDAKVQLLKIKDMGPDPPVKMGKEVALAPENSDFDEAARWTINISQSTPQFAGTIFVKIAYQGDVARLYTNGRLLTDNFYNGTPWFICLDRIPAEQRSKIELRILPLSSRSPFYLPKRAWPSFPPDGQLAEVTDIQALPEYEAVLKAER